MLVDEFVDRFTIEVVVNARPPAEQLAAHVFDTVSLEPARIGRREPLLLALGHLSRNVSLHHFAKKQLAVLGSLEVLRRLCARLVLVQSNDLIEIAEL